ncbi:MAG TPA: arginine--tRNA ligase, partial [Candidatus Agathobaculum intestinigallinarum]|nr:arginine--tRNA ligase [Candidatus Agathobaculum intestinigallinarum]
SHRLEIVLMQLVRMMQGGEVVRMSKRTGKSLTLTDLLDEIPVDAARFFFNSRAAETQMEFDLDLAVKQDSDNPLYYVQYAHARICSVIKNCLENGVPMPDTASVDLSVLTGADERQLIKQIALLPEEIAQAAASRDPSRLNKYAVTLAQQFHHFYNACRIKCDDEKLCAARLSLCLAARQAIANTLGLIGVEAPEAM